MNVKELKEMLEKYPDDMEVLTSRCSDYEVVEKDEWSVVEAVPQSGYVMRGHSTMSNENKLKMKKYLFLNGN